MTVEFTRLTCPDCRGSLEKIQDGNLLQYRCRVGHAYSPESAIAAHASIEENTLWAAVVALEEGADLWEEVAANMPNELAQLLREQAKTKRHLATQIRALVQKLETPRFQ